MASPSSLRIPSEATLRDLSLLRVEFPTRGDGLSGRPEHGWAKGKKFRDARDCMKDRATGTNPFVYVDMPYDGDWRIATSRSSLAGFAALARSSYLGPGSANR
jgi:hypothetical protein